MTRRISVGHKDRWIVSSRRVHAGEVDSERVGVPPVGLLSELETYRYLSVGMFLG